MTVVPGPPKITYRRVLAIDPAVKKTGWAVLDADGRRVKRVVARGVFKYATPAEIDEFAAHLAQPALHPDVVAIEDQYLDKNVHTLIRLVEMRVRFQHSFQIREIPVVVIPADEWQMGLLSGMITRKSRRIERKAACLKYIQSLHDPKCKSQDEADAIAIGVWAVRSDLVSKAHAGLTGETDEDPKRTAGTRRRRHARV